MFLCTKKTSHVSWNDVEGRRLRDTGTCPPGYVRHASSCYQFVNASKTWAEAEKHCQMTHHDSHLISIETRAEMEAIVDYRTHNAGYLVTLRLRWFCALLQRVSIARYAERCTIAIVNPSVRLSVRLSHAVTVSIWLTLRSWGLHWRRAPWL